MDIARSNSVRRFINSRLETSGVRAVFSDHEGTKINITEYFEKLNVVELYNEFHQVLLLSPLKNTRGLSV